MRHEVPRIREQGAELVVVGNGQPWQAKAFKEAFGLDFPLLTDPKMAAYRAAELRRSIGSVFNLRSALSGISATLSGHTNQGIQGDPWQQGGAFVITPDNRVLFSYVSQAAGDHPEPDRLIAPLRTQR